MGETISSVKGGIMDIEIMGTTQPSSLPPIVFSEWFPWLKRNEMPSCYLPGIYLLARFVDSPPETGRADPLSSRIVVIGETSTSLRVRWNQFDSAAFREGRGSHSEGHRYREKRYPNAMEALYVAAMPSSPLFWRRWTSTGDEELAQFEKYLELLAPAKVKGPLNRAWIKFVERKLILDFVLKWGVLPECNAE